MASYDGIEFLVFRLKNSMIDLYMTDLGYQILGDYYLAADLAVMFERPTENGTGGGLPRLLPNEPYASSLPSLVHLFKRIGDEIDLALSGWRDLPEPSLLDSSLDTCRNPLRAVLASGASVSTGSSNGNAVFVAGTVGPYLESAIENAAELSGLTMEAFKTNVLREIPRVVSSLDQVAIILGGALLAEQGAIDAARQAIADLVEATEQNCAALAQAASNANSQSAQGPGLIEVTFKFVAALATTAAAFATGPAAAGVLTAGASMLTFAIDTAGISDDFSRTASSFDSTLSALKDGVHEIDQNLRVAEEAIDNNLRLNYDAVLKDATNSFQLTLDAINSEDIDNNATGPNPNQAGVEALVIDRSKVEAIYGYDLPQAAAEIAGIRNTPLDLNIALYRDQGIGLSPKGPTTWFFELTNLLRQRLTDLEVAIRSGRKGA